MQINLTNCLPILHPSGCYKSSATFTSNLKTTWIKPWFDVFLTLRPWLQQFMNAAWGFVHIWEICGLSTLKVSQVVSFPLTSTFASFRCLRKKDDDGNLEIQLLKVFWCGREWEDIIKKELNGGWQFHLQQTWNIKFLCVPHKSLKILWTFFLKNKTMVDICFLFNTWYEWKKKVQKCGRPSYRSLICLIWIVIFSVYLSEPGLSPFMALP